MVLDLFIYTVILVSAAITAYLPLVKDVIKKEPVMATKKKTRVPKKPAIKGGISFKRLTPAGRCFIFCIALFIGFSVWQFIRDNYEKKKVKNDYNEVVKNLAKEIKKLNYTIDTLSDDPSERVTDGFSLFAILQVNEVLDKKKKYIFDCGESTTLNRLSLYLDFDNNLVLTIIDNSGVPYSVRAVPNFISFKEKATYFLHCSIGYSKDFSFIRIFLDDRLVGIQTFNNKISAEKLNCAMPKIGCDMENHFCGSFYLSSLIIHKKAFKRKEIIDIMNRLTQ